MKIIWNWVFMKENPLILKKMSSLHLPQFNQVYGIVKSSIQSFFQKSQEKFISKKNVLLIVLIHLRKYYIFEDMVSFFGISLSSLHKIIQENMKRMENALIKWQIYCICKICKKRKTSPMYIFS
eukprot:Anaeramoba_ignava/a611981_13.p1 GENE.a611981_13~~a611981_13.p1  ORF type:complete len:124 (-),score=19.21 a611981_13:93-464(-)